MQISVLQFWDAAVLTVDNSTDELPASDTEYKQDRFLLDDFVYMIDH